MKRYLAFAGSVYYPGGGMDDFVGDFDSLEEAKAAALKSAESENWGKRDIWRFRWANVWDSFERRTAWEPER